MTTRSVPAVLRDLLDTRRRETQLVAERDQALVAWRELTGWPKASAGLRLRGELLAAGWSEEELELVGVSVRSVRASLERPRPVPA